MATFFMRSVFTVIGVARNAALGVCGACERAFVGVVLLPAALKRADRRDAYLLWGLFHVSFAAA